MPITRTSRTTVTYRTSANLLKDAEYLQAPPKSKHILRVKLNTIKRYIYIPRSAYYHFKMPPSDPKRLRPVLESSGVEEY